ncbi:MAG: hypothetical protein AAFY98_01735 [Verrucomicrobiota bacterium]
MMRKVYIILGLGALFLAGLLTGGVVTATYIMGQVQVILSDDGQKLEELLFSRMSKKLGLDEQQQAFAQDWLGQITEDVQPVRNRARAEIESILSSRLPQLREQLDTDQNEKLDRWLEEMDSRSVLPVPPLEKN